MKKKLVIGITGNIGSGKSIVSDLIESEGYSVIRSDLLAKDLMLTDSKIKKQLVKNFGEETFSNAGLNAKFLAENVFSKKKNVEKINSIVHPPVIREIKKIIKETKSKIVFVESALIFEARIEKMFDYIMLVSSDEITRINRVIKRDGVQSDEVKKRLMFQLPDSKKKILSHFIIENNSTKKALAEKIFFMLRIIKTLAG